MTGDEKEIHHYHHYHHSTEADIGKQTVLATGAQGWEHGRRGHRRSRQLGNLGRVYQGAPGLQLGASEYRSGLQDGTVHVPVTQVPLYTGLPRNI